MSEPTPGCPIPPLDVLRALFSDPVRLRPDRSSAEVTELAAAEFAALADSLRSQGNDPQRIAHFLMRLLFCLFAEDIRLLPPKLFSTLIQRTHSRPSEFQARLADLFHAMASGGSFGVDDISYFNGDLFTDAKTLPLSRDDLQTLLRVSSLDWSSIEPAIFGTLFERSLDPDKRSQLGAHYTSRDDILLIVEPVLMTPLRRRWAEVKGKARKILEKALKTKEGAKKLQADFINLRPTFADPQRSAEVEAKKQELLKSGRSERTGAKKLQSDLYKLLNGFVQELAHVRVLDPACGSGNFLYVSLKLLLDLWKEVSVFAATHGLAGLLPYQVGPSQLYGIEKNVYAHELASVVVWIGYIQWLHDNGYGVPPQPILQRLDNIRRMDAILAHDEKGNPLEPEWPEADVIVGNPPFLGGKKMRSEIGDKDIDELFELYDGRVPREADLVTYWFEKARAYVEQKKVKRVGLLATQAIRGGANRRVLERIKETGDIFWAQSDRDWILDGANVHVSMVGFDDGAETECILNGSPVSKINPDLTGDVDLTAAQRLQENMGICFMGDTKGGPFDISSEIAAQMIEAPLNPNGRPNSDVVCPWTNGSDLTGRPRGMFIVDFGKMSEEEAALYEKPFQYILKVVHPKRIKSRTTRSEWWLHERPRPEMRAALSDLSRYVATVRVSKHRLFVWLSANILSDSSMFVFAHDDDYFFGVLQSHPHELWSRRTGTQLREVESGFRYTPRTCFDPFPFPWPPGKEPTDDRRVQAIAAAAKELVELRDRWLNPPKASEERTASDIIISPVPVEDREISVSELSPAELKKRTLTNLYNQRPQWLDDAHRALDRAVLAAYGWPQNSKEDMTDSEILERLLALNRSRAAEQEKSAQD